MEALIKKLEDVRSLGAALDDGGLSAWNKVTAQFGASIGFQRLRGTAASVNESLQGFDRSRLVKSNGTPRPFRMQ
jgi:hypothetical protein